MASGRLLQLLLLLASCSLLLLARAQPGTGPPTTVVMFQDDFKTLDRSIWTLELGDGSDYGIPSGWGNNELQCYTDAPENVAAIPHPDNPAAMGDGVLCIRSVFSAAPKPCINRSRPPAAHGKQWTSARLTTRGARTFTPRSVTGGCGGPISIEARIKMPGRQGHWGAFWALGATNGAWPQGGEIDIAEHVNRDPHIFGTVHFANAAGAHEQQPPEPANRLPVANAAAGWNVYRVDWSCESIAWFVKGEQRQRLDRARVGSGWVFDQPFYLILNLAVGGNLPGFEFDAAGGEMLVDYVKVTAPAVPSQPQQSQGATG